ncbi:esterase/lipase family protein [Aquincola tertiaricarbonis]|uniref:esterase/lipase family protein n=1 Tax=Aquincola tertiaricarbonis TaxID=391953 RepID=UPI000614F91F|nr:alpha/beta fold hydrolase [Aquincola tertiaricarbonis]
MTVARLQQALVLAILAALVLWNAWWWPRGQPVVALLGSLLLALPHAPVLALEFWLMRRLHRDQAVPRARPGALLRAWWHEVACGVAVFGWRQPFRSRAEPDHLEAGAQGRTAVVLVHGFMCNRAMWNPWMRRLRAAGHPFVAVTLGPPWAPVEHHAPALQQAVQRARQATGRPPLVVAHSMGGLVVRAWLRSIAALHADPVAECTAGIVTIATPHGGTWLARFGRAANARQMRLGSAWLAELQAAERPAWAAGFTCFHSNCDNVVFPVSAAVLPGADNRLVPGMAHVQLLGHPAVLGEVLRRLTPPPCRS